MRLAGRPSRDQYGLKISAKDFRQIETAVGASGESELARLQRSDGFEHLVGLILDQVDVLNADVLDAHVRGYSTSGRDLLHDLIP